MGGYNVQLDGNLGDEIDYQLWIGSATGFGGERDGAVDGSNGGADNFGGARCSGSNHLGRAATGAAYKHFAGARRTRRAGANGR